MTGPQDIRADFVRTIGRPGADFDLARVALLVAAESDPRVDTGAEMGRIEAWAAELRNRLDPGCNNLQKLARLRSLLYEDLGFRGDRADYFSPSNSLLNEVMARRLGIPLTLGILMLELGWRVGMPLEGVGFPGHFLVRLTGEARDLLLDPFEHGRSIHEEDCRRILEESTGGSLAFEPGLLASVDKRGMIQRLLNNLKGAYLRGGQEELALGVVERLLIVAPDDPGFVRDRGLLLIRVRRYPAALGCLGAYLEAVPDAPDRAAIERQVAVLRHLVASLN